MSYWLNIDVPNDDPDIAADVAPYRAWSWNHTSNQRRLFQWAFGDRDDMHWSEQIAGRRCADVAELMLFVRSRLDDIDDETLAGYDSPNGWGTGASARSLLMDFTSVALIVPEGVIRVTC